MTRAANEGTLVAMDSVESLVRHARSGDIEELLPLWASLFDEAPPLLGAWVAHAREWFATVVDDRDTAVFPVVEADGAIVACAIGTLEAGVPNPQCLHGRVVRLSNVVTLPEYQGRGHGSTLVDTVTRWARAIGADRVDLSATPAGQRIYERAGFVLSSAPRMKLPLTQA